MIASRNPLTRGERVGTVIRLNHGDTIRLDEILAPAQGRAILAELDETIADIEAQLADDQWEPGDPTWAKRASYALQIRRRARGVLQQRVVELTTAEKPFRNPAAERRHKRQVAFINAAEETLNRDLFVEIWERAANAEPEVFEDWKGLSL